MTRTDPGAGASAPAPSLDDISNTLILANGHDLGSVIHLPWIPGHESAATDCRVVAADIILTALVAHDLVPFVIAPATRPTLLQDLLAARSCARSGDGFDMAVQLAGRGWATKARTVAILQHFDSIVGEAYEAQRQACAAIAKRWGAGGDGVSAVLDMAGV